MEFTRLWVDKHRPTTLEELTYNDSLTGTLKQLAQCDDLPHLIFYGQPGVGKKTRVMCLLNEIYGKGVYKLAKDTWKKKINTTEVEVTSKFIQVPMLTSKFHIDLTPSDAGNHDKTVIQTLIKETASTVQLNSKSQKNFMTIIFNESEKLSGEAQASLRRTMERYVSTCRLVLICENLGNLIPALLSRCLLIRCRSPSNDEIAKGLEKVANLETHSISMSKIQEIAANSNQNLRRAILGLQNDFVRKSASGLTASANWKKSVQDSVKKLKASQTPATLKEIRCYDLLVNCIPPGMIIRAFVDELLKEFDSQRKPFLLKWAAYYEEKLNQGSKELPFIEAFLAQVMLMLAEQKQGLKVDGSAITNLNP